MPSQKLSKNQTTKKSSKDKGKQAKSPKINRKKAGTTNKTTENDSKNLSKTEEKSVEQALKLVSKEETKVAVSKSTSVMPEVLPRHYDLAVVSQADLRNKKKDEEKDVIYGLVIYDSLEIPCLIGHVGKEGKNMTIDTEFKNTEVGQGYWKVVSATDKMNEHDLAEMLEQSNTGKQFKFLVASKFFVIKWPLWVYTVELNYDDDSHQCLCHLCQNAESHSRDYNKVATGAYIPQEVKSASDRVGWQELAPMLGIKEGLSILDFVKKSKILDDTCFRCREAFWKEVSTDEVEQIFWTMENLEEVTVAESKSAPANQPVIAFGWPPKETNNPEIPGLK
jgi:hypothetical protein